MQLDKLVNFHKTIGDKTRIRIISLLKEGPLHGQALAGKLGLTPPTISHHVAKLREINIIYQRREKNTIYFHLNEKNLELMSKAILRLGKEEEMKLYEYGEDEKSKVLNNFVQQNGKVRNLPAQHKKRLIILEHLIKGLEMGRTYSEPEINEHIMQFYDDYATVRREFIMNQFMFRQDGQYELNPKEMWPV